MLMNDDGEPDHFDVLLEERSSLASVPSSPVLDVLG